MPAVLACASEPFPKIGTNACNPVGPYALDGGGELVGIARHDVVENAFELPAGFVEVRRRDGQELFLAKRSVELELDFMNQRALVQRIELLERRWVLARRKTVNG